MKKVSKPFIHYDYMVINEKNKFTYTGLNNIIQEEKFTMDCTPQFRKARKASRTLNVLGTDAIN